MFLGTGEMLPTLSFLQTFILSVVAVPMHFGGVTTQAKKNSVSYSGERGCVYETSSRIEKRM